MRYCPSCLIEYAEDDATRCTECDTVLVNHEVYEQILAERDEALTEPYERLTTLESRFEAPVLTGALDAEGIRHLVRSYQDSAYDGIYVTQKGWGALFVPKADLERAREVVEASRRRMAAEADDAPPADES